MNKNRYQAITNPAAASDAATSDTDDTIVVLTPTLAAYVLQLIASDLEHGIVAIISDVEEDATALGMFLHDILLDVLPAELRTTVPALAHPLHTTRLAT